MILPGTTRGSKSASSRQLCCVANMVTNLTALQRYVTTFEIRMIQGYAAIYQKI